MWSIKKKKIQVFENFKIPLLAYALMDLAGIWTIPLVFYAGHFKPQGRVRCGQKKKNLIFSFQVGQKSSKKKNRVKSVFFPNLSSQSWQTVPQCTPTVSLHC